MESNERTKSKTLPFTHSTEQHNEQENVFQQLVILLLGNQASENLLRNETQSNNGHSSKLFQKLYKCDKLLCCE